MKSFTSGGCCVANITGDMEKEKMIDSILTRSTVYDCRNNFNLVEVWHRGVPFGLDEGRIADVKDGRLRTDMMLQQPTNI